MSYTLNYRGAKIDELLGQVDEQFIAEYNVALYADITAAIAAGKQVLLKKDNALYPYIGQDATSAYTFAMVDEDAILQLFTVSTASVWATVSKALQEELTFDAAPTDGSTNPVTSDGIYDAIEEAKAEAQEQSYDLLVTDTASGAIATFPDGADDIPVKSLIAQITPVQSGTGDPSPDNIRPISGWTGAKINADGVNVWDEVVVNGYWDDAGVFVPNNNWRASQNYIPIKPSTAYYCKTNVVTGSFGVGRFYDENKNFIGTILAQNIRNQVFTTPSNAHFLTFYTDAAVMSGGVSINYPSTDTSYHAYNGNTINIDWTDEAGTVYGGTLNVTTGELTVNRGTINFSTVTITKHGSLPNAFTISGIPSGGLTPLSNLLPYLNTFPQDEYGMYLYSNVLYLGVPSSVASTVATFRQWAIDNGLEVIYGVSTPQTYQLTPTEVKTLLGDNSIWADCGNVDVVYRADPSEAIDEEISKKVPDAPAEAGTYVLKVTVVEGSDPEYAWEASE